MVRAYANQGGKERLAKCMVVARHVTAPAMVDVTKKHKHAHVLLGGKGRFVM